MDATKLTHLITPPPVKPLDPAITTIVAVPQPPPAAPPVHLPPPINPEVLSALVPPPLPEPGSPPAVLYPDRYDVLRRQADAAEDAARKASSVAISVKLERYIVNEEDDGGGGNGVDLYLGYLTQELEPSKHGTTPVVSGLKNDNGNVLNFRTHHRVDQDLFTLNVHRGTPVALDLRLIEADETTSKVIAEYSSAGAKVIQRDQISIEPADVAAYFLGPMETIVSAMQGSNSDDDYGQWRVTFQLVDAHVQCTAWGCSSQSSVSPQSIHVPLSGTATMNFQYLDAQNNIVCVLTLGPF